MPPAEVPPMELANAGEVIIPPVSKFRIIGLPTDPLQLNFKPLVLSPKERVPQTHEMSPATSAVAFHVAGVMAVWPLH